jgi:hypothetical protein
MEHSKILEVSLKIIYFNKELINKNKKYLIDLSKTYT